MSSHRRGLITQAFKKLDKVADGAVTVDDLRGVYNVSKHPKFISGEWNEEQCLKEFLTSFDTPNNFDGRVFRRLRALSCLVNLTQDEYSYVRG